MEWSIFFTHTLWGIVSNAIFLLITVHVHCTYYDAQEDTSERSGINRGQNFGIADVYTSSYQKMTCVARPENTLP